MIGSWMKRRRQWRKACLGSLIVLPLLWTGCSKHAAEQESIANPERNRILQCLLVYRTYLSSHNQKPPPSTAALQEWALKEGKDKLKLYLSVEDALKSPRDGDFYALVPPHKGRKMGPQMILVYEKTGKNGKHFFAGEMGTPGELDDKQLEEALQGAK